MPMPLLGDEDVGILEQGFLRVAELAKALLPLRRLTHTGCLHGGYLVLGAVGCPIRVIRSDDVGARLREMKSRVNHAGLNTLGDTGAQYRIARAAGNAHPIALGDTALLGIMRMNLEAVFIVPLVVLGAPRLRADVVLAQDAPGGE